MTKPQISAEQMLEVARSVYPEYTVELGTISKDGVYIKRPEKIYREQFNPSLTGTAEQKAHALDVIVAARKIQFERNKIIPCMQRMADLIFGLLDGQLTRDSVVPERGARFNPALLEAREVVADYINEHKLCDPLTAAMLALLESTK